jgi:catechol 2,3-dioxygenase-like lactoylglutathione lyase family enzyme
MRRLAISWAIHSVAIIAILGAAGLIMGQTSSVSKSAVTGTGSFTSFVEDMDRSLAFYHDAFGMEVPALPASGQRPYNPANPQLFKFFDIAGAKERHQSARVTGTRVAVEMMEIQDVPHQTIPLRIQDPGTAMIVFIVRDVDALLARAVQAKASVETPGGKPVTLADGGRAILIRDIDGRLIELRELPQAASSASDILDMRLSITVNDIDETKRAYQDVLGFKVQGEAGFGAGAAMRSLTGLSKAEVRRSRVQAPGSSLWIEFVEFKGVPRTPLHMRIQDRGAARLQLRVQDVDAVVTAVKAAGLRVMSVDGVAQPIPPNFKGALIADPNNFFLTAFAPCDGCAPGLAEPGR